MNDPLHGNHDPRHLPTDRTPTGARPNPPLPLHAMPGHLVRRIHQLNLSLYAQHAAGLSR